MTDGKIKWTLSEMARKLNSDLYWSEDKEFLDADMVRKIISQIDIKLNGWHDRTSADWVLKEIRNGLGLEGEDGTKINKHRI